MRGSTGGMQNPGANTAAAPTASVPSVSPSAMQNASQSTAQKFVPWLLFALGVLYFAWAWLEEHEKIKAAVQPGNIKLNIMNLAKIALSVIVAIGFLKIGLAKLAAWGIPGAAFVLRVVSIV